VEVTPVRGIGKGLIEPSDTAASHAFLDLLPSGRFHRPVTELIPTWCIDGRPATLPLPRTSPMLAGGIVSLLVGLDLAGYQFADRRTFDAADIARISQSDAGHPGVHLGPLPDGMTGTGCAAMDRAALIYRLACDHSEHLRSAAESLGLVDDISVEAWTRAVHRAEESLADGVFEAFDVVDTMSEVRGARLIELAGLHDESAAVFNTVPNTTLEPFEDGFQVFHADVWAIEPLSQWLARRFDVDSGSARAGMLLFNLAALVALCGPEMPFVRR